MGCGRPGPGGPGTHKVFEWNLQWAGTHKVLAEKVSGYGNFRWFTYANVYSCKMLTFWYTWYDGMTYTRMYKYMLAISMGMYTCTVYSRVVQMFPSKEPNFWLRLTHRSQIYILIVNEKQIILFTIVLFVHVLYSGGAWTFYLGGLT